ncbi:MAG TPA: class GN sortase [Casimicrobiaceae bacterium]|nr:class GN sortase [Casimicrobiaceae bacterium]
MSVRTHWAPADRGGSFGWNTLRDLARAECEGAAPGTEFRACGPAESSPLGRRGAPRSLRPRYVRLIVVVLSAVGTWGIGGAAYIHAKAAVGQWLLERAWQQTRLTGAPVKPWPWADTYPVGRLIAPTQHVAMVVLAGASGRTLAWGPGHLDDSALPGSAGNSVLSAHRDTHFAFLRELERGDTLIVETADGTRRHYRVRAMQIADARDIRIPRDSERSRLTLVTCYPFDAVRPGGPLRYIVVADAA